MCSVLAPVLFTFPPLQDVSKPLYIFSQQKWERSKNLLGYRKGILGSRDQKYWTEEWQDIEKEGDHEKKMYAELCDTF